MNAPTEWRVRIILESLEDDGSENGKIEIIRDYPVCRVNYREGAIEDFNTLTNAVGDMRP